MSSSSSRGPGRRAPLLAAVLGIAMILAGGPGAAAAGRSAVPAGSIDPVLAQQLATASPSDLLDVAVVLTSHADLSAARNLRRHARLGAVERALRTHADRTQRGLRSLLATRQAQHLATDVVPFWVTNEIDVRATPAVVRELAARGDVATVRPRIVLHASALEPVTTAPSAATEPNIDRIGAPAVWAQGFRGQGIVVATMDTGVDASHPDLASTWRGGTNSWYDPNGQHPTTPTDVNGHGTATMGVIVGGAAGGSSIGVAPAATWIAVKIFDDRGAATSTAIHRGFQWLLDPDGNPATADAPNVVNDSWTMSTAGCSLEFQADLRSLRAAGILPVFAAGNEGPTAGSVRSPANNPEALAVGGTDNADALYAASGRGPSSCAGASNPTLAAPAVGIRTTDLYGLYLTADGTSLAAPHVTGALALLLDAFPDLSADRQETALEVGAVDLGPVGFDDDVGYGRLDVAASYQWLATTPDFTLAATPTSVTVAAGGSTTVSLYVAAVRGFTGDVDLSLAGLTPAQGAGTFSPVRVVGGVGGSTLTVTTDPTLPAGSYPLTVTGTSGAIAHAVPVTLVVPAAPSFTVGVSPATVTAPAGGSATVAVSVASVSGFSGDVSLSLAGLAAPSAWSFAPAVVTGGAGSSTLTVTTDAALAAGSYPLTITGTSGTTTRSATVTLVVPAPPSFTLGIAPAARTTNAGGSVTFTVSVAALNGFAGPVSLSFAGVPQAAGTGTFSRPVVTGAGTSVLTIATPTTAPGGTYPVTVTGTSGALVRTVSASLVVVARDFSVAAAPSSVTVTRGQTASSVVTVAAAGGFTGPVSLAATGLPAGSSATFTVNPVATAGTSTIRVRTTSQTPRGTFTVRVTGTNGSLAHQTTVTLVVR
ncbi:S8 family serine peptidase [Cellulomonas sp. ICMP 17802]|uniref:S8 family serine peptidase n=1 Tax=Cellulomonas sp. ICMP 17802 TaxID=3239199 RepID=UPI00351BAE91